MLKSPRSWLFCIVIVLFLLMFAARLLYQSRPPASNNIKLTEELCDRRIACGKKIVYAIYQYQEEVGLWPSRLSDLAPCYIDLEETHAWRLSWQPNGWWKVVNYDNYPNSAIKYEFVPGQPPSWSLTDGSGDAPILTDQPMPVHSSRSDLSERRIKELARRCADHPTEMSHWRGLVSTLYLSGNYEAALKVSEQCLSRHPDDWWPNLALALALLRLGDSQSAEKHLVGWVDKHKSFSRHFFLSYYYLQAKQPEKAFDTLRTASPLLVEAMSPHWKNIAESLEIGGEWFLFYSSLLAYQAGRFGLCVELCSAWEKYIKSTKPYEDHSFLAIRSAAYLSLGEFAGAKQDIVECEKWLRDHRIWASHLEELRLAVLNDDRTFVYDPCPPHSSGEIDKTFDFTPFIDYK